MRELREGCLRGHDGRPASQRSIVTCAGGSCLRFSDGRPKDPRAIGEAGIGFQGVCDTTIQLLHVTEDRRVRRATSMRGGGPQTGPMRIDGVAAAAERDDGLRRVAVCPEDAAS